MRQRRGDPAHAVWQLAKVASSKRAIVQQIEQKRIHVASHRLHRVQGERIAVTLVGMQNADLRIAAVGEQCEACFGLAAGE